MSMLAEPKKKLKWSLNPRGTLWTNDENKFGHKLLEKMGWQKGKGLGKEEHGMLDPLRSSLKSDTKGVGYKGNDEAWVNHFDAFENVLSNLNNINNNPEAKDNAENETSNRGIIDQGSTSLESKSKESKARVHYHKFTRGKDLSQYKEDDLACILGSKQSKMRKEKEKIEAVQQVEKDSTKTETEIGHVDTSYGLTTHYGGNFKDYFAKKMLEMKQRRAEGIIGGGDSCLKTEKESGLDESSFPDLDFEPERSTFSFNITADVPAFEEQEEADAHKYNCTLTADVLHNDEIVKPKKHKKKKKEIEEGENLEMDKKEKKKRKKEIEEEENLELDKKEKKKRKKEIEEQENLELDKKEKKKRKKESKRILKEEREVLESGETVDNQDAVPEVVTKKKKKKKGREHEEVESAPVVADLCPEVISGEEKIKKKRKARGVVGNLEEILVCEKVKKSKCCAQEEVEVTISKEIQENELNEKKKKKKKKNSEEQIEIENNEDESEKQSEESLKEMNESYCTATSFDKCNGEKRKKKKRKREQVEEEEEEGKPEAFNEDIAQEDDKGLQPFKKLKKFTSELSLFKSNNHNCPPPSAEVEGPPQKPKLSTKDSFKMLKADLEEKFKFKKPKKEKSKLKLIPEISADSNPSEEATSSRPAGSSDDKLEVVKVMVNSCKKTKTKHPVEVNLQELFPGSNILDVGPYESSF